MNTNVHVDKWIPPCYDLMIDRGLCMGIFSTLLGPVVGAFTSYREGKVDVKKARIRRDIAKLDAESVRFAKHADIEADWDLEALRQSQYSWKDEALTVVFFLPFLGAFIPGLQPYVANGFEFLKETPVWYQACIIGIVANAFGLRWLFQKTNVLDKFKNKVTPNAK